VQHLQQRRWHFAIGCYFERQRWSRFQLWNVKEHWQLSHPDTVAIFASGSGKNGTTVALAGFG